MVGNNHLNKQRWKSLMILYKKINITNKYRTNYSREILFNKLINNNNTKIYDIKD